MGADFDSAPVRTAAGPAAFFDAMMLADVRGRRYAAVRPTRSAAACTPWSHRQKTENHRRSNSSSAKRIISPACRAVDSAAVGVEEFAFAGRGARVKRGEDLSGCRGACG